MADIIRFEDYLNEEPDLSEMDREELLAYLEVIRAKIAQLDAHEPRNMASEAHEEWGEAHEELEDIVDDILDCLDALD